MDFSRVVVLALAICACGNKTSTSSPSGNGAQPPPPTAPAAVCRSADDCALVCFRDASDCCGDACGCEHAFLRSEAERIGGERDRTCAGKKVDCPKVRCVMKSLRADCQGGKCVAVPDTSAAAPDR